MTHQSIDAPMPRWPSPNARRGRSAAFAEPDNFPQTPQPQVQARDIEAAPSRASGGPAPPPVKRLGNQRFKDSALPPTPRQQNLKPRAGRARVFMSACRACQSRVRQAKAAPTRQTRDDVAQNALADIAH